MLNDPKNKSSRFYRFKSSPTTTPLVSVVHIVSASISDSTLNKTIESLKLQSLQSWECIFAHPTAEHSNSSLHLVDNDSRFIHVIEARSFGEKLINAISKAKSDIVFLLDAAVTLEQIALETFLWTYHANPRKDLIQSFESFSGSVSGYSAFAKGKNKQIINHQSSSNCGLISKRLLIKHERAVAALSSNQEIWELLESNYAPAVVIPQPLLSRRLDSTSDMPSPREMVFEFAPWLQFAPPVPKDPPFPVSSFLKEKKSVLLIAPWVTMGGADKFNLDLVKQLNSRDWEVSIITTEPEENKWIEEFKNETPEIFVLSDFLPISFHPIFIRKFIDSRNPDVVLITHSEIGYCLLPYLRHHCPDPVYVDYSHIVSPYWINFPAYGVRWQPFLDLNIVSSLNLKQSLISYGASPDKIEVAYTNVDTDLWKPNGELRGAVRKSLEIDDGKVILLYSCRLDHDKRPKLFAFTIAALKQLGFDNFVAVVAGDGPERNWLEEFVKHNNLEQHIRTLGTVTNARICELMSVADIFFLPSLNEGISLALYEAMASALTPVVSNVGGQAELVTQDCGFLINRGELEDELKEYVICLANLLSNTDKLREYGINARKRVSSLFRINQMGERMVSLFMQAKNTRHERALANVSLDEANRIADQCVAYSRVRYEIVKNIEDAQEFAATAQKKVQLLQQIQAKLSANPNTESFARTAQSLLCETGSLEDAYNRHVQRVRQLEEIKQNLFNDSMPSIRP